MASKALQDQFWGALNESESFKKMTPEQQAAVRERYLSASDEELNFALTELKKDSNARAEREAVMKKREAEQIAAVTELKETMRAIERDQVKANIDRDRSVSDKKADEILGELEKISSDEKSKKRKKWFGIF